MQVVLRPRRQREGEGESSGSRYRRAHPVHRQLHLLDRVVRATSRVLDRTADRARFRCQPDSLGGRFRCVAEAVFKIGPHRQVGCPRDRPDVGNRQPTTDRAVSLSDVPWIGDDDCGVALVERAEEQPLLSLCRHHGFASAVMIMRYCSQWLANWAA